MSQAKTLFKLYNMKKKYLIITLFILSSNFLFAQYFSIGLRDGISWSGINGYDFERFQIKDRTGQSFGLLLNYRTLSFLILQAEINYEEKGFDFQTDPLLCGGGSSGNFRLKYLTIPFTSHFEIGNKVMYYGYAGVYVAIRLKAENSTSVVSNYSPDLVIYDMSYDPTDIFNKHEFGGLVGIGIKIPLCEKVKFIIDSRYSLGLTKASKNKNYDYNPLRWSTEFPDDPKNVYNRSLTISLGILYQLNHKK